MLNEQVTRIYRETVGRYGSDGVERKEAVESAVATLLVEVNAGRIQLDVERALRDQLRAADEADGRNADVVIHRAASGGELPLSAEDMERVVTLGRGRRKQWADVNANDLREMNELRYENFLKIKNAYATFKRDYSKMLEPVLAHRTVGAAFAAGAFDSEERAA